MSSELRVKFPETISTMDDLDKVKVIYEEVFSIGLYMHKKDGIFTDTTGAIFIYKDDDRNHIIAFYIPEGDTFTLIEQPVVLTDIEKVYGSRHSKRKMFPVSWPRRPLGAKSTCT
ncbi:MAG: hypothetical protein VCD00_04190 [Candidatus Hydrogenedentota bacterium]